MAGAASDAATAELYGAFAAGMSSPDTTGNNPNNKSDQTTVYGLAVTESTTHAASAAAETAAAVAASAATYLNSTAAALNTAAAAALAAATAANEAAVAANASAAADDAAATTADTAATTADTAATAADSAALAADTAAIPLDAAAGVADGVSAGAETAAAAADTAADIADATALATVEIPFVDIGTAAAAAIATGIEIGLDVTSVAADTADGVADGLADVADTTAAVADAAAVTADTAATTADTAATAADATAVSADTTATSLDAAATAADEAAVAACKAADAANKAAEAAEKTSEGLNTAATVTGAASAGADDALNGELETLQSLQTTLTTQTLDIADQLSAGIRSLDLRGTLVNDTINLNSGEYFTGETLQGALNDMTSFLEANPSETIVVTLSANESASINSPDGFNADLNTLLNSSDTAVSGSTYKDFIYYSPDSSVTPDLGAVRGKIVLIPSADQSWTPSNPSSGPDIGWQPTEVIQDSHTVTDPNTRWNYAENDNGANDNGLIPTDLGNPSTLYVNNLTQDNTTADSPVQLGDAVDAIAEQYFGTVTVTRTAGIVGMDDPTNNGNDQNLINDIIDENKAPIIVTSDSDAAGAMGTLRDAITQANSQTGFNIIEFAADLAGTTGNTIVLQSNLPQITNDLDIAGGGSIFLDLNGFTGFTNAANHQVTETDLVASDGMSPASSTSTDNTPVYVNISGVTTVSALQNSVDPVNITYGTALENSQLNGVQTATSMGSIIAIAGTFTYTSAAGTVLGAGNGQSEAVTFTPTDTTDYSASSTTVIVNVAKATPVVAKVNPVNITDGTALATAQLSGMVTFTVGGNPVTLTGIFTYTNAAGHILHAANGQSESVTFTPTDTTDYTSVLSTVNVNVTKANPSVTLNPLNIGFGTPLDNTQLSGTVTSMVSGNMVTVPGTFTYTTAAGTVLDAGNGQTEAVTFTPADTTDYKTVSASVTVNVSSMATPTIAGVNAVNITYGTALANSQLSGTAIFILNGNVVFVQGAFSYTTAAGSVLSAGGGQSEAVTFTPTNSADYNTTTSNVIVNVAQATPTIAGVNTVMITYGTALANSQLSGSATFVVGGNLVSVPGSFSYTIASGAVLRRGQRAA